MYQSSGPLTEAVLFFDDARIIKEMLFSEFEAVLDGVVDLAEFAEKEMRAVFLQVNSGLQVEAAVFFVVPFDEHGQVLRAWNVPLRHVAEVAGNGPDMGCGPIRLACRTQCPVPWHQRQLWDPVMKPEGNSFVAIRNAIRDNRLNILTDDAYHQRRPSAQTSPAQVPVLQPLGSAGSSAPYPPPVGYAQPAPFGSQNAFPQGQYPQGQYPQPLGYPQAGGYAQAGVPYPGQPAAYMPSGQDGRGIAYGNVTPIGVSQGYVGLSPLMAPSASANAPLPQESASDLLAVQASAAAAEARYRAEAEAHRVERDKAARLIKKLRLQVNTLETQRRDESAALHREFSSDVSQLTEQIEQLKHMYEQEKQKNQHLKETLSEQAAEFHLAREQFLDQIEEGRQLESEQLAALRRKFELELRARLETETNQLKEMLDMREVELYYREEQISGLRAELGELRQEKMALLQHGSDRFMEKLRNSGITFVAFHPGVGHITIPLDDVGRYLDSPTAYAAEKAFVSEEQYLAWLNHYYNPVCTAELENGEPCLEQVERVNRPAEFIKGKADRCSKHRHGVISSDAKVIKMQF